jgi:hypothetical protein
MSAPKILNIAIILVIIMASISAGCTGSGHSTPADNTPQPTQVTMEATAILTETPGSETEEGLKPGDKVSSATVTSNNYTWYEYLKNTTSEMPPNGVVQTFAIDKTEYSNAEYDGEPAFLVKSTHNSKTQGWSSISELYYDTSRRVMLCGTRIMTDKDNKIKISIYPPEEGEGGNYGYFWKNITLTYQGTESVTVPAGTFPNAGKYTHHFDNDFDYTYWFVPGIPVPVLSQNPNRYIVGYNGFESRELMDWG